MKRREFVAHLAAIPLAGGCTDFGAPAEVRPGSPRLLARPGASSRTFPEGYQCQQYAGTSFCSYLPRSAASRARVPVMLFLHGALRTVEAFLDGHRAVADETGVCVVAPYAAFGTWDAIGGTFGPDVAGLDVVLGTLFSRLPVDPDRVALSGFSDGATYALAIGRANGDLFRRIVAYSPGFLIDVPMVEKPPVVVSHGTQDRILSYAVTRDVIVPGLRAKGYNVTFESFVGDHAVPLPVLESQMRALVG